MQFQKYKKFEKSNFLMIALNTYINIDLNFEFSVIILSKIQLIFEIMAF